jgi:hypothetical protein
LIRNTVKPKSRSHEQQEQHNRVPQDHAPRPSLARSGSFQKDEARRSEAHFVALPDCCRSAYAAIVNESAVRRLEVEDPIAAQAAPDHRVTARNGLAADHHVVIGGASYAGLAPLDRVFVRNSASDAGRARLEIFVGFAVWRPCSLIDPDARPAYRRRCYMSINRFSYRCSEATT